jgi:UDP-N-acetylmuramoylalanine--D-glutamate ligase
MNVAIIGYGAEGKSALAYWQKRGEAVTVCDVKTDIQLPDGVTPQLGPGFLDNLDQFDLIVRSPGIKPSMIKTAKPVTSVTREFFANCPVPIIGVTGTKGKGTTSSLIAKILETAGHKVWLGGNIGVPPLDFLEQIGENDKVVLELSSFQLIDLTQSPQVAAMLMLSADHLDYHSDEDEYHQAKANIYRYQQPADRAVYNAGDKVTSRLVELSPGQHVPYGSPEGAHVADGWVCFGSEKIIAVGEVGLIGEHNLENICAALASTRHLVADVQPIAQAIKDFKGLPHRLEFVGALENVRYYDDSFSTNPMATVVGVKAFAEPKVLIVGGYNRAIEIKEMVDAIASSGVKHAILIGETAQQIAEMLATIGFKNYELGPRTMPEIVALAKSRATAGDVVLLSPGFASFDMFENYKVRGELYQAAVKALGAVV